MSTLKWSAVKKTTALSEARQQLAATEQRVSELGEELATIRADRDRLRDLASQYRMERTASEWQYGEFHLSVAQALTSLQSALANASPAHGAVLEVVATTHAEAHPRRPTTAQQRPSTTTSGKQPLI